MYNIYFDTETTGLYPGQICQLAYLLENESEIIAKNFFFKVDYMDPAAYRVHGFSCESLKNLSGGKVFRDNAEEILDDFKNAHLIIAHNAAFDNRFMQAEASRICRDYIYRNTLCSMRYFTNTLCLPGKFSGYKYPSLAELAAYFKVEDSFVRQLMASLFGSEAASHDARHDICKMYLCVHEARRNNPALENLLSGGLQ